MLRRWATRPFTSLLGGLPSQCFVCRAWPAQPVCEACVARFAPPVPRCGSCAIPLRTVPGNGPAPGRCADCAARPLPLDACLAACSYAWPWPGCIAQFKFRGDAGLAAPLAILLLSAPWVEPAIEQADLLLPMPLAPGRLRERGFNQAHELARRLEPRKSDPGLLLRLRETPAQSSLDRRERLRNLHGAFALDPKRGAAAVRGRRLVLVDDVMTSGASLYAAAAVLRAAGAAHITAVVLARTDAPD
jgi:ComF family protein